MARTIRAMMNTGDSAPVRPSSRVAAIGVRELRDDAGEDDQRDAIADAARGDLFAEPHQEHRPPTRVMTVVMRKNSPGSMTADSERRLHALEPDGEAVGWPAVIRTVR